MLVTRETDWESSRRSKKSPKYKQQKISMKLLAKLALTARIATTLGTTTEAADQFFAG